jgi:multidrug efflux pump subunit AcrA (membrane-fusion protein)
LELQGTVSKVAAFGETVQGLVKYTVRVTMTDVQPSVLIGMSTNVNIVTSTQEGALVVPIAAVQTDTTSGEYVNRVKADGTSEKVKVVSGSVEDNNTVIVTGDLKAGDKLLLGTTTATTTSSGNNRNGGAGGPGLLGGG